MRLGRACSGFDLRRIGRIVSIGDVVRDRAVGEEGFLRDVADRAAQRGWIDRCDVLPIEFDAARLRVEEAQQQFQQRGLAAAGAADKRDRRTGRHVETHAIHRDPAIIRMAHVVETQSAAWTRIQRAHAARRQRGVEQIHHPIHRSHRALVQVGHVGKARQRPQQSLGEVHQCGITADAKPALQGQPAAVQHGRDETREDSHPDHRRDRGGKTDRLGIARAERIGCRAHVFALERLGGVGLDRGHAGEVVVQTCRHRRRCVACGGVAWREALLEPERTAQDQRDRQQCEHREARGEEEKHRADQQRGHEHLDQVVRAGVEEAFDLVDVFVHQRHQPAAAFARDRVRRQLLQMRVRGLPQRVLQILRESAPLDCVQVFEQRLEHPHRDRQRDQREQLVQRIGNAHPRQERCALVDDYIDRDADQQLGQHVEKLVERRVDARQHRIAAERAGEGEQAAQRMLGGHDRDTRKVAYCPMRAPLHCCHADRVQQAVPGDVPVQR